MTGVEKTDIDLDRNQQWALAKTGISLPSSTHAEKFY